MAEILDGAATPAQIAGFVVALRMKGESVDELTGLLDAMLEAADLVAVAGRPARPAGRHRRHRRRPRATRSTSRRWPASWWPAPACPCASTATGPRRRAAARPTCSRRSASTSSSHRPGVADCVVEAAGMAFCFAPRVPPGPAPRRADRAASWASRPPSTCSGRWRTRPGCGRLVVGRGRPGHGRAHARGAAATTAPRGCWSCTATTASTSSPRRPRRRCGSSTATSCGAPPSTPRPSGWPGPRPRSCEAATRPTNARLARAVLAGERGPHRDVVVLNAAAGLGGRRRGRRPRRPGSPSPAACSTTGGPPRSSSAWSRASQVAAAAHGARP